MDEDSGTKRSYELEDGAPVLTTEPPDLSGLWFGVSVLVSIGLTHGVRAIGKKNEKLSKYISQFTPSLAVLVAIFVQALLSRVLGNDLSWAIVGQGIAAGAAAVFSHAQYRSLLKHLAPEVR